MVDLVKEKYTFEDLVDIMGVLRGEDGCPWDREQTHQSIRRNLLEESYEACEAIDSGDSSLLCEELGDVLLQVVFHASISDKFTIEDILTGICRKLVTRHPHVFGGVKAENADQALDSWNSVKLEEKRSRSASDEIDRVAKSMPALMYAQEVQKKAAKVGFDWPNAEGAMDKLSEEILELKSAEGGQIGDELGDLLFSAVNVSRFLKVDAEHALLKATGKFARRFKEVERMADGKLSGMSLAQMDKLWDEVKSRNG